MAALAAFVAFVLTLCACSNDPDALIGDGVPDSGGMPSAPTEPEEPPWLPVLPDADNIAACTACSKRECVQARESCLQDDACTAQLECMRDCDDPGCAQECQAEHAGAGWWSPWWEDLFVCVYGSCRADCKTGRNWGCSHRFDWPRAEVSRIAVRARFGGSTGTVRVAYGSPGNFNLSGARLRVCPLLSGGCEGGPFDEGMLDAANSVALDLPPEGGSDYFRGYFEIESEQAGRFQTRYRMHPLPTARAGELRFGFLDSGHVAGTVGWRPSDASTSIWTYVVDCTTNLGSGLRIELADEPEAQVLHLSPTLAFVPQESTVGIAFLPEVTEPPDGQVTVRALLGDGDEEVARRSLPVRNGWMTHLQFGPPARGEE